MQSAVRERVDDAELLADRRREHRDDQRRDHRDREAAARARSPVRAPSSCLRVTGSDSVKSAEPFVDSRQQSAAAEQHREEHAHLRQVVAEGAGTR